MRGPSWGPGVLFVADPAGMETTWLNRAGLKEAYFAEAPETVASR